MTAGTGTKVDEQQVDVRCEYCPRVFPVMVRLTPWMTATVDMTLTCPQCRQQFTTHFEIKEKPNDTQ